MAIYLRVSADLLPANEGYIKIDGEQIDNLGLHVLRKGLCIIPQDSFVFSGTLKFNVDPYKDFDDQLVYDTLEKYGIFESLKSASENKVGGARRADQRKKRWMKRQTSSASSWCPS